MRRSAWAGAVPRGLAGPILVMLLAAAGSAWAQDKPAIQDKPAKVTHDLLVLEREYAALAGAVGAAQANALFKPSRPGLRVAGGLVAIDAVADGDAATLLADLQALGLQNGKAFGRIVSGRLPIAAISAMAALPSLRFARPAIAATRTGSVTSQGDVALRADIARATYGVTGSGVKVGTLSDSYNCLGGAPADVASGDLPSGVVVLEELAGCVDASDEGRAIMQIIHDVAPGTTQAFHTAFNGMANFAQGILDLASAGAKVIVDDVIYFAEPMFQDGIVAQAVDTVAGMGVAYFSSAGNDARRSYEHAFTPGTTYAFGDFPSAGGGAPPFFGGEAHDFDPGPGVDVFQKITIPAMTTAVFAFQWNQPFFSVSGGAGSLSDYDIYLFDDPPTTVLYGSVAGNGGGDPVEVFTWTTAGTPLTANLMLVRFGGPAAEKLKYVISPRRVTIHEYATNSSTLYGHANAVGATAVGAAFFGETPAFGVSPPLLEPFSSAGGTPILFLTNGTPTSVTRPKPEIVAPDGGNTTFFVVDDPIRDPDFLPNFFGTSASAPHAAGVAALMWHRNPTITPSTIRSILQSTTVEMGPPGFDFDTGFGLIQADVAVAAVPFVPPPPPPPPPNPKIFTVPPCRVADTRLSTVPLPVAAGLTLNGRVRAPLDGQGGAPDCGVPDTATAVFINVVAVAASGPGHLTVFPFGSPAPLASSLNFTTGQTVAGSALVPICSPAAGCAFDISVLMGPAAAHLVIDITGYLSP